MSDSDSDSALTNNVFTFQNESTMVSAKGPNTNLNNITGISFRNNVFSSTSQMSQPYKRQRYAESSYDQRSLSSRRGISPMSVRSACDMRPSNLNYSYNPRGMCAPRSAFNGRSGSPVSIRSIDSSTSCAADIANAFKNVQFNKYELKIINEAYNRFVRRQVSKKIDNRRYRKIPRRKRSGYDSGEQASDSSLSSDDRSVRTTSYKDNMSSCRSTITDILNFKRKIKGNNMLQDRTDHFKFNSIRNITGSSINSNTARSISSCHSMPVRPQMSMINNNLPVPANFSNMLKKQTAPAMLQKERFHSGYLLPSQRFNKSVVPKSIPENSEKNHNGAHNQNGHLASNKNLEGIETDSDEDIFSNATKENLTKKRKRGFDGEDIPLPNKKKNKISPCKNSTTVSMLTCSNEGANDFVFTKPMCPARKSVKEKLISKSAAPLDIIPQESSLNLHPMQDKPVELGKENLEEQSNSTCDSTSLSMRPSFIKRKLFTQKLDVADNRNLSMENIDSPQNSMYGAIQKEKHKARKVQQTLTQSCLSRDIQEDNHNNNSLKDLIHKIVPVDQMNRTNKTVTQSKDVTEDSNDKWDVTAIISTHKINDDESDTYTDEEILNSTIKELQKDISKPHTTKDKVTKNTPKKSSPIKLNSCKIILEKLPANIKQTTIKQFWDTDFESDVECQPSPRIRGSNSKENHRPDMRPKETPKAQGLSNIFNFKKPTYASIPSQNYTFDTTQKFNNTLRIRSHRAPKRNKHDQTTDEGPKLLDSVSKQKHIKTSISTQISDNTLEETNKLETKKSKQTPNKTDNKKSPKGKKQSSKTDKQNQSAQKPKRKKQDNNTKNQINVQETISKQKQTQQKANSKKQDIVNKALAEKLSYNNKKVEAKPPNNKSNSKSPKTKKNTQKNSSLTIEENNNKTNRTMRSCRTNSKNRTADKSNLDINETINRTLRSGKDLSNTSVKNSTKVVQKNINNYMISRLSDVSFSLAAQKNTLCKKAVTKLTNLRLMNTGESDVSFSLTATPTPRKTRSSNARKDIINSTPLRRNSSRIMEFSNIKTNRKRIPNKRYVY